MRSKGALICVSGSLTLSELRIYSMRSISKSTLQVLGFFFFPLLDECKSSLT